MPESQSPLAHSVSPARCKECGRVAGAPSSGWGQSTCPHSWAEPDGDDAADVTLTLPARDDRYFDCCYSDACEEPARRCSASYDSDDWDGKAWCEEHRPDRAGVIVAGPDARGLVRVQTGAAAVSDVERIVYLLAGMTEEQRGRAREAVEAIAFGPGASERAPWASSCPNLHDNVRGGT